MRKWCAGFAEAIRFDADNWAPLLGDEDQRKMLVPLWMMSIWRDAIEDDRRYAKAVTQTIDILRVTVSASSDYWNPQRRPLRVKRVLARRRPSSAVTTFDNTAVAMMARDPAR